MRHNAQCELCGETYVGHSCEVDGYVAPSGARSSEQKPRYDLIPRIALEREAQRMAEGAAAHGELNYLKGRNDPVYIRERTNHMIEHALLFASGDTSTDHLSAIRCNAAMLMELTGETP